MTINALIPLAARAPDTGNAIREGAITGNALYNLQENKRTEPLRTEALKAQTDLYKTKANSAREDERLKSIAIASQESLALADDPKAMLNYWKARKTTLGAHGYPTEDTDEMIAALEAGDRQKAVQWSQKGVDMGISRGYLQAPPKPAAWSGLTTDAEGNRWGVNPETGTYAKVPGTEGVNFRADPAATAPEPTSRKQDWDVYQQLKTENPEEADAFGRQAGFVTDEGQELSVHLQKRLSEANDAATESRANAVEFETLASEIEASNLRGGIFGGTWGERVKDVTGSQDAVTRLRQRYMGIRSSMAVKNLPPGVASDKDIELALKGFPTENANKETITSFLRGMSKLETVQDQFETFKADYISENGSERNLLSAWRAKDNSGGKLMVDAQGNRALVYPDGRVEEQ